VREISIKKKRKKISSIQLARILSNKAKDACRRRQLGIMDARMRLECH
jgi:hypothetical protein